ncbi:MAG: hypothetical protein WC539_04025 [Nitrospirota bacterium]
MIKEAKSIILYHRSHRRIAGSLGLFFLQYFFFIVPLFLVVIFFYPYITHVACSLAHAVLAPYFPDATVKILQFPYFLGNASYIDLPGKDPTLFFSLLNALASLALLIFLPTFKKTKHMLIFFTVVAFINFVSSLFFLFFPNRFPYEVVEFSELYIKQQISIWLFIPVITGLAVLPLPSSLASKVITVLVIFLYSLVFGAVRYVVFLFVLGKVSMLYMAIFFFVLGPLIDFVYVVGIYGVYVARLAENMRGNFALWKWS